MNRVLPSLAAAAALLLAACAPTATGPDPEAAGAGFDAPCASDPPPVVAVVEFENTTGRFGTTVTGVEEAATARLITLLKESGCYEIVEQSELQNVMMQQGLESMEPEALAEAAGAGYVITGTVTRATIAEPGVSVFGVSLGETRADVEVDVRATDIITGSVVVSETGAGTASSPNIAVDRIPSGRIAYDDPTVGPILADASALAVRQVVGFVRATF
jgi:curli biogenesis system outer membrane secretion channel CsgG